jgi:hypothetical protein
LSRLWVHSSRKQGGAERLCLKPQPPQRPLFRELLSQGQNTAFI